MLIYLCLIELSSPSLPREACLDWQEEQLDWLIVDALFLCWIRCSGPAWPDHPCRCPSSACHRPSLWFIPAGGTQKPEDQGCPGKSLERILSFRELELYWLNNLNQTGTRPILFAGKSSHSLWIQAFPIIPFMGGRIFPGTELSTRVKVSKNMQIRHPRQRSAWNVFFKEN